MKAGEKIKTALGLATALFISVPGIAQSGQAGARIPVSGKGATRVRSTQRKAAPQSIGGGDPRVGITIGGGGDPRVGKTIGGGGDPRVGKTIGGGGDPRITDEQRRMHDTIRREQTGGKLQKGGGIIVK